MKSAAEKKTAARAAQELLRQNDEYTCVLCRGDCVHISRERGVKPLIDFLKSGISFQGCAAADRVVGKAAAFLYILLGAEAVYADVMSESAIETFSQYGIQPLWEKSVKAIQNRTHTGLCPMEKAVQSVCSPDAAYKALIGEMTRIVHREAAHTLSEGRQ